MTTFYVGQRVRIVSANVSLEALGKEATVIGFDPMARDIDGKKYAGYDLVVDGIGRRCPSGLEYCFEAHRLEPLIPPRHQPAEVSVDELLPFLKGRRVSA